MSSQLSSLMFDTNDEFWTGIVGRSGTGRGKCCSKVACNAGEEAQKRLCDKLEDLISQIESMKEMNKKTYVAISKDKWGFSSGMIADKGDYVIIKLENCIIKQDSTKCCEVSEVVHYDRTKKRTILEGVRILRSDNDYCKLILNNGGDLFYGLLASC